MKRQLQNGPFSVSKDLTWEGRADLKADEKR